MIINTSQRGLFLTGTDTDVGKTYIGSQIVSLLQEHGIPVAPRKPIESGCKFIDGELQPDDAKHYYNAVNKNISLDKICPYRFEPAISPQRAAQLVNKPLSTQDVAQACLNKITENDFLFIEGAGGFYSPLCEDGLNADLAKNLQLPVLLIAENKLGCINQILLTVQAIQHYDLELYAIVLNSINTSDNKEMNNFEDLKTHVSTPIFPISKNQSFNSTSPLINHLLKLT
jgi:dethiobiotin synthetase